MGKPIVVSTANVAASGAYYIAGQRRSLLLSLSDFQRTTHKKGAVAHLLSLVANGFDGLS